MKSSNVSDAIAQVIEAKRQTLFQYSSALTQKGFHTTSDQELVAIEIGNLAKEITSLREAYQIAFRFECKDKETHVEKIIASLN
jgi:ribosomal protein S6